MNLAAMKVLSRLCSMAMVSLVVLVIQNSLLVVMTRFSRKNVEAAVNYYTSTLVLNQECVKMLLCLIIYAFDDVRKEFHGESSASLSCDGKSTSAVVAEVDGDVFPKDELLSQPMLKEAEEKAFLSPHEHSETLPWKQGVSAEIDATDEDRPVAVGFTEEDSTTTATEASTTVRRNVRVLGPSSFASPPPPTTSNKPTDSTIPRRNKVRFVCMRAQAAASLYCSMLRSAVIKRDTLKLLVPAFLFNLQNFLIFVGLSNLDAVSFQVWSQTKLLSTALFSVWLLHRRLSLMQWFSLVVLTAGVLGAQLGAPKSKSEGGPSVTAHTTTTTSAPRRLLKIQLQLTRKVPALAAGKEPSWIDGDDDPQANPWIGIAACVLSGLSSSYAGVYFEKVVKTTSPTLSIRNVQLSIFGIPFAFLSMLLLDVIPQWYEQHRCNDPVHWNIFRDPHISPSQQFVGGKCPARPFYFWQRYDQLLTWGLVAVHAFGGLLVAIVVKYADNILKGFATGVAVIVSGIMSSMIWGYKPTFAFVVGAFMVVGSSIMFHKFEPKR